MRRPSGHRPPALRLPDDPQDAAAQALAFIRGDDSYSRAQAVEALSARIEAIKAGDSDAAMAELAAQAEILRAVWLRFVVDATAATKPEHKATLFRMALAAQKSFSRTLVLLSGFNAQRRGKARVTLDNDAQDD